MSAPETTVSWEQLFCRLADGTKAMRYVKPLPASLVQRYLGGQAIAYQDNKAWHKHLAERWSRAFGPVVKVDRLIIETVQEDEEKEPFAGVQGQGCA